MLPCKQCTKREVSTKNFVVPVYSYNDNKGFLFYSILYMRALMHTSPNNRMKTQKSRIKSVPVHYSEILAAQIIFTQDVCRVTEISRVFSFRLLSYSVCADSVFPATVTEAHNGPHHSGESSLQSETGKLSAALKITTEHSVLLSLTIRPVSIEAAAH